MSEPRLRARPPSPHLVVDEKHTERQNQTQYIATTASQGCILGASLSERADASGFETAYGVVADEAQTHDPDYQPQTVTVDGWNATHRAWKDLFPEVHLILCVLHAIFKIRDLSPVKASWTRVLQDQLWNVYHAISKP